MKNWLYFFIGTTIISTIYNFYLVSKVNNSEINIKRQVQRNKHSPDNVQEYNATQTSDKKKRKLLNLKRNKHEKQ